MLLPQFPGMTVDLAYARQVPHRSGAVGRCMEDVPEPVARRPWPLPRSTYRAQPIENAPAYSLETIYAHAGEPRNGTRGRRGGLVRIWNAPTRAEEGRHSSPGQCGRTATSEHPDYTLVATWGVPQYKSIFRDGGGRGRPMMRPSLDRRLQPFAAPWQQEKPLRPDWKQGNFLRLIGCAGPECYRKSTWEAVCRF
jgi:hypothetical protein